ncbi:MAG: (Fe-S)-binding protein [Bacillota bacterium]
MRAHLLPSHGKEKYRVAFFTGCITEVALGTVIDTAIELLRHASCTVIVPPAQTCCGALSHHCGDKEAALRLARRNLAAFEAAEPFDFITGTAAACIVHLQEYPELFPFPPAERNKTERFSSRVRDFAGLLLELEPALIPTATGRAAYHESCLLRHGANSGGIRQILSTMPGVEPVPAPHLGCCGSAGGYFFRHPEVALSLLDAEIGALKATGAGTVVTDNPGCLLFLRYGLDRHSLAGTIKVLHLAEFLKPREPH